MQIFLLKKAACVNGATNAKAIRSLLLQDDTEATSKMTELTLCTESVSWEIWEIMKIFDCDIVFIVNRYTCCFSYGGSLKEECTHKQIHIPPSCFSKPAWPAIHHGMHTKTNTK